MYSEEEESIRRKRNITKEGGGVYSRGESCDREEEGYIQMRRNITQEGGVV